MRKIVAMGVFVVFVVGVIFLARSFYPSSVILTSETATVEIVRDYKAASQEYKDFFEFFIKEFRFFLKGNGEIRGYYRIPVLEIELEAGADLGDKVISVILDGSNPSVINDQKISCLNCDETMQIFAKETIQRFSDIFYGESDYEGGEDNNGDREDNYGGEIIIIVRPPDPDKISI